MLDFLPLFWAYYAVGLVVSGVYVRFIEKPSKVARDLSTREKFEGITEPPPNPASTKREQFDGIAGLAVFWGPVVALALLTRAFRLLGGAGWHAAGLFRRLFRGSKTSNPTE